MKSINPIFGDYENSLLPSGDFFCLVSLAKVQRILTVILLISKFEKANGEIHLGSIGLIL
jgi:hypothetical protein